MKLALKAIAVTATLAAFTAPTFLLAQDMDPKTVTCAQFTELDASGKLMAVDLMHQASPDAATMLDDAGKQAAAATTTIACEANPDMLAMDAMKTE